MIQLLDHTKLITLYIWYIVYGSVYQKMTSNRPSINNLMRRASELYNTKYLYIILLVGLLTFFSSKAKSPKNYLYYGRAAEQY